METCIILPKLLDTAAAEASSSLFGGMQMSLSAPALSLFCSFRSCVLLGKGESSGLASSAEAGGVGGEHRRGNSTTGVSVGGLCLWVLLFFGLFFFFCQLVL